MKQCDTMCALLLCRLRISLNLAMIHEPTPSKLWQATVRSKPAGPQARRLQAGTCHQLCRCALPLDYRSEVGNHEETLGLVHWVINFLWWPKTAHLLEHSVNKQKMELL